MTRLPEDKELEVTEEFEFPVAPAIVEEARFSLDRFHEEGSPLRLQLQIILGRKKKASLESFFHLIEHGREQFLTRAAEGRVLRIAEIFTPQDENIEVKVLEQRIHKALEATPLLCLSGFEKTSTMALKLASRLKAYPLQLMQNDILLEPYQIYEARHAGFHCVILHPSLLSASQLLTLVLLSKELGMDVALSLDGEKCLDKALSTPVRFFLLENGRSFMSQQQTGWSAMLDLAAQIPEDRQIIIKVPRLSDEILATARELKISGLICPNWPSPPVQNL